MSSPKAPKIFLFEYATCTQSRLEPSVAIEGYEMFRALYAGFKNPVSFYNERNYEENFLEYLGRADFALAIAPESELLLYNLAKLIEKTKCENLGSSSKAIEIAGDKFLTSKAIKEFAPKTEVFKNVNQIESFEMPAVIKPRHGTGGEGIKIIKNEKELEDLKVPENCILQEYIEGKTCSASLLINTEVKIISSQTQEIENFKYTGAKIPVEINNKNKEEIIRACEKIKGLHGFAGVDFILSKEGEIKIIEINARPTTPIVALNSVFGFNISELILKNHFEERLPDFKPKKKVFMKKINNNIILEEIK